MKFNLINRIVVIAFVPSVVCVVAGAYVLREAWNSRKEAIDAANNLAALSKLSTAITEVQRERGRSAAYVSGGAPLADVTAAREKSDAALTELDTALTTAAVPSADVDALRSVRSDVARARTQTDSMSPASAVAAAYTALIGKQFAFYETAAEATAVGGLGGKIEGLSMLEFGKEKAGQLRANLTPILAADVAIDSETQRRVIALHASVDVSLNSPGIQLSESGRQELDSFTTRHIGHTYVRFAKRCWSARRQADTKRTHRRFCKPLLKPSTILGALYKRNSMV